MPSPPEETPICDAAETLDNVGAWPSLADEMARQEAIRADRERYWASPEGKAEAARLAAEEQIPVGAIHAGTTWVTESDLAPEPAGPIPATKRDAKPSPRSKPYGYARIGGHAVEVNSRGVPTAAAWKAHEAREHALMMQVSEEEAEQRRQQSEEAMAAMLEWRRQHKDGDDRPEPGRSVDRAVAPVPAPLDAPQGTPAPQVAPLAPYRPRALAIPQPAALAIPQPTGLPWHCLLCGVPFVRRPPTRPLRGAETDVSFCSPGCTKRGRYLRSLIPSSDGPATGERLLVCFGCNRLYVRFDAPGEDDAPTCSSPCLAALPIDPAVFDDFPFARKVRVLPPTLRPPAALPPRPSLGSDERQILLGDDIHLHYLVPTRAYEKWRAKIYGLRPLPTDLAVTHNGHGSTDTYRPTYRPTVSVVINVEQLQVVVGQLPVGWRPRKALGAMLPEGVDMDAVDGLIADKGLLERKLTTSGAILYRRPRT